MFPIQANLYNYGSIIYKGISTGIVFSSFSSFSSSCTTSTSTSTSDEASEMTDDGGIGRPEDAATNGRGKNNVRQANDGADEEADDEDETFCIRAFLSETRVGPKIKLNPRLNPKSKPNPKLKSESKSNGSGSGTGSGGEGWRGDVYPRARDSTPEAAKGAKEESVIRNLDFVESDSDSDFDVRRGEADQLHFVRLQIPKPSPHFPQVGLWKGLYGPHGLEVISVSYDSMPYECRRDASLHSLRRTGSVHNDVNILSSNEDASDNNTNNDDDDGGGGGGGSRIRGINSKISSTAEGTITATKVLGDKNVQSGKVTWRANGIPLPVPWPEWETLMAMNLVDYLPSDVDPDAFQSDDEEGGEGEEREGEERERELTRESGRRRQERTFGNSNSQTEDVSSRNARRVAYDSTATTVGLLTRQLGRLGGRSGPTLEGVNGGANGRAHGEAHVGAYGIQRESDVAERTGEERGEDARSNGVVRQSVVQRRGHLNRQQPRVIGIHVGEGQIASTDFQKPSWIDGRLIVYDNGDIAFLWLGHVDHLVKFRKLKI
mmetsp:Transcript_15325/g.27276  ORF Transcript_15325/g.27276 Transcript_15325/m.27276 type:complete len:547 (-) Transcript_15325:510-2150(-)